MDSRNHDISQLYKKHSTETPDQNIDQAILDLANKNKAANKAIWQRPVPLLTVAASLAVVSLVFMLQQQVPASLNDLDNQGLAAMQGPNVNHEPNLNNVVDAERLKVINKLALDIRQSTSEQQKKAAQKMLLSELEKLPHEALQQIPSVYLSLLSKKQQEILLNNNLYN